MSEAIKMRVTHRIEVILEVVAEDDGDAHEIATSLSTDFITRVEVIQVENLAEEEARMIEIWDKKERLDLMRPLYEREIDAILKDFSNP